VAQKLLKCQVTFKQMDIFSTASELDYNLEDNFVYYNNQNTMTTVTVKLATDTLQIFIKLLECVQICNNVDHYIFFTLAKSTASSGKIESA